MSAAVVYKAFAPFHHARLRVTGAVGRCKRDRLLGTQGASTQPEYRWPYRDARADDYTRVTLFRGQDVSELRGRAIYRRLIRCLNALQPDVVVVPGWGRPVSLYALTWCLAHRVPRVIIAD